MMISKAEGPLLSLPPYKPRSPHQLWPTDITEHNTTILQLVRLIPISTAITIGFSGWSWRVYPSGASR
jgi:hypothetical protein